MRKTISLLGSFQLKLMDIERTSFPQQQQQLQLQQQAALHT